MDVSDSTLASIAEELKDRLRFSHVILKSTKQQLLSARESAEKQKSKAQRKQQTCEEKLQSMQNKLSKKDDLIEDLRRKLSDSRFQEKDLELTLASKEEQITDKDNEFALQEEHWGRRTAHLTKEKAEVQSKCRDQEEELYTLKKVSKERILTDSSKIRQLTEKLRYSEKRVTELEFGSRGYNSECYQKDCYGYNSEREQKYCCKDLSLNLFNPCEEADNVEKVHTKNYCEDDCSGCVPAEVFEQYNDFRYKHLPRENEYLLRDYDELIVQVDTAYHRLQKEKLLNCKKRNQQTIQSLRRQRAQTEPYVEVVGRERVLFLKRLLEKCQRRLQSPNSNCAKQLRSISDELQSIIKQLNSAVR